jgi:hypothetical protein
MLLLFGYIRTLPIESERLPIGLILISAITSINPGTAISSVDDCYAGEHYLVIR